MSSRQGGPTRLRRIRHAGLLGGCVLAGLLTGPVVATAAAKKAELTFGGGAVVAMKHESAYIEMEFLFFGHAECSARDNLASVGVNPSKTVKVTGSNKPLADTHCENEKGTANGGVRATSISVTAAGKVAFKGSMAVELATGCKYVLNKEAGTVEAGAAYEIASLVQASLQKGVTEPAGCTKTITGEGEIFVGDLTFEQLYHVNVIG